MNNKDVILLACHDVNETVIKKYFKLTAAAKNIADVYLLIHQSNDITVNVPKNVLTFIFTYENLKELKYSFEVKPLIPGKNHLPVLLFYSYHPEYRNYWNIEYDVEYNGNWKDFFNYFNSEADFITCHIKKFDEEPLWIWWNLIINGEIVENQDKLRSFNPIYRISQKAISYLKKILYHQSIGHHEVLMPTALHLAGYKIVDFGGKGKFVKMGDENRFYISSSNPKGILWEGTMKFNPVFKQLGNLKDKLYHPIKK